MDVVTSDAPELVRLLTELREGLDGIRNKMEPFLKKVEEGHYATKNGISYLETKHLLLMFYCQSIVFYILLKAEGRSVHNHPVIARLVEIRMFLEKIRPIDKKLHYQMEKLLKLATGPSLAAKGEDNAGDAFSQDALMYRPNPDMLVSKTDEHAMGNKGVYRPPMIAPTAMDEERSVKDRRSESRAEKEALRRASRSVLIKELANELEGKPEEIRETVGAESKEMSRERARLESRAQQEENLFARVPLPKAERQKLKHLKRSRNGLMGMLDDFDDDISNLVEMEEDKSTGVLLPHLSKPQKLSRSFTEAGKQLRNLKKASKLKMHKGGKYSEDVGERKADQRTRWKKDAKQSGRSSKAAFDHSKYTGVKRKRRI